MDLGLALPYSDWSMPGPEPLRWDTVADLAQRAEALGFGSVWLADHLYSDITKHGGPPEIRPTFDPLIALAALARITSRVRLGTLVLCTQLRPPTVAAKQLATIDILSGGRTIIGMGAGWLRSEFEAAGMAFERREIRLDQLAEGIELVARLLVGERVTFTGAHSRAEGIRILPPPVQRPRPPIWVGGPSDGCLEVAARVADGWNTCWAMTPEEWSGRAAALDAACERHGRDPAEVTRSLGLLALVGEDEADLRRRFERMRAAAPPGVQAGTLEEFRVGHLVGTVEQVREQLATWESLGVASVIASLGALSFSITAADDLDILAAARP